MKQSNDILEFKAIVKKQRFKSDDYKIYVVDIDKHKFLNIEENKNNEYVIVGNLPTLIIGIEYDIKATIETNKSFGIQYKVKSIRRDKPNNLNSSKKFLLEIITELQTETLLSEYPNIIDKVIKNDLKDVDLNKLKGIGEFTFGNIKSKIIENFCLIDLVDEFGGLIEMNIIKKLYDKYPSPSIIKRKLKEDAYKCLCDLSRVGFRTADSILINLEIISKKENKPFFEYDLKTSKQRMRSCLNFILDENESNGNTNMSIITARKECGKLVPECIGEFVNVIKESKDIYVDNKSKTISNLKTYNTELYISNTIKTMLNNKNCNMIWDIPLELYRPVDGFDMTDEQLSNLKMMCENNIGILTAPAGAGKSASVQGLINMLEDNDKKYILMTPTGASSEVLQDYTKRECGTIHRQLKYNPSNENPWGYNKDCKLPYDIVIIDEFSMVDIFLFSHVLDAIDIAKTKILFVFDSFQLSSVGCGNIAQDLLSSGIIPTTVLTKIFRYNEGGLMQVVTSIRNSDEFLPHTFVGTKIFGAKKDFIFSEINQENIPNQITKIYNKILNDDYSIQDIMILSCQNKGKYGTKEINKHIQKLLQSKKTTKFIERGETRFHEGDKVIQMENNYKAKGVFEDKLSIFNGNTGIVTRVNYNEILVTFKNNKQIIYTKQDLNQLELGYCISIHRSQGGNAKQVIVISPSSHTHMLNSNLLYVGGTRAKERVYMLGNIRTVNAAIKEKENLQRNTYLKSMLIAS